MFRAFDLSRRFSRFLEELKKTHPEFFKNPETGLPEDLDAGLPPGILERSKNLLERYQSKDIGMRYEEETLIDIKEHGIEAIAIYVPYHLSINWGIYVFLERLSGLSYIVSKKGHISFDQAFEGCKRAVFEHESFHFLTEYIATITETIKGTPLYLPYFYKNRPYCEYEEAAANAWMLTLKSPYIRLIKNEIRALCDISPPGYRDYINFISKGEADYNAIRTFWTETFLNKGGQAFFPTRIEMPSNNILKLIPIYYVNISDFSETKDAVYCILANYRIHDILTKLVRILPQDIQKIDTDGGHQYYIYLRNGMKIPVPYHGSDGGYKNVKIVNEVADALGIERKQLRERVLKDP